MIGTPWLLLGAAIAVAAAAVSGYRFGVAHCQGQEALTREVASEAVDAVSAKIAESLAAQRPKYTTIKNEVEREVRTNTVYADCKVPPVGIRLINQALDPAMASSAAVGTRVPADSLRGVNEALRAPGGASAAGGSELPKAVTAP